MYALIIYLEDDIYQVCLESTLKLKRNVVMGKFLGKYYPARIVTRSDDSELLENLQKNLEEQKPIISVTKEDKNLCDEHPEFYDSREQSDVTSDDVNDKDPTYQISDTSGDSDVFLEINNNEIVLPVHNVSTQINQEKDVKTTRDIKKNSCFYCKKLYSRLPEHLEMKHKSEEEVKLFSSMPKGNKDRKKIIETIRRRGNFDYNNTVYDPEKLILCRKPRTNKIVSLNQFIPCPTCKGMFSKNSLRKHYKHCNPNRKKGQKNVLVLSRALYLQAHDKANNIMKNQILPVLRNDKYSDIIRYDYAIILYGNKLAVKYRSQKHHQDMIRQKLRQAARFLFHVRAFSVEITDLASIFHPKFVDISLQAINEMAGYCEKNRKYKSPSTASAVGTLLKFLGAALRIEYIKNDDVPKRTSVENYMNLLNDELTIFVNRTVLENQKDRNRSKQVALPSTNDIECLHSFLKKNRRHYYKLLSKRFDCETWNSLASFTLTSVQVFNRRRAGEIERARIVEFRNHSTINNEEFYNALDDSSKKLADHYIRFEIRGKLGRGVPVLLSRDMENCITLILRYREDAGVRSENPFIFGIPKENDDFFHLKATVLLRKYSVECGATHPVTLRGTILRKHLATTCVRLDLKDSDVTDIANFMGHHEKIHLDHYRQPIHQKDILRMSQLLEQAQGNISDSDEENYENRSQTEANQDHNDLNEDLSESSSSLRLREPSATYIHRRSWTTPEKKKARELCDFTTFKLPSLDICQRYTSEVDELKCRTPNQLKAWICNELEKAKKPPSLNKKQGWTTPERKIMREYFHENFSTGKLPSLKKCEEAIKVFDELKNRTPKMLKARVYNQLKKMQGTK